MFETCYSPPRNAATEVLSHRKGTPSYAASEVASARQGSRRSRRPCTRHEQAIGFVRQRRGGEECRRSRGELGILKLLAAAFALAFSIGEIENEELEENSSVGMDIAIRGM